jgi:hypothetical protein
MSEEPRILAGCNDRFAELCALSTAGSLTAEERRRLEAHVVSCPQCASLLAEYNILASEGMAKLGAVRSSSSDELNQEFVWDREEAKARLLSSVDVPGGARRPQPPGPTETSPIRAKRVELSRATPFLRIAAVVTLAVFGAYQVGLKTGVERAANSQAPSRDAAATLRQQLADAQAQRAALDEKLASDSKMIAALEGRASRAEREWAQLRALNASLEAKTQDLGAQNQQQSTSLLALSAERESLQQKLRASENVVQSVRQDLSASQDDRQEALLRSASLETQINQLLVQLRERDSASQRQEQYLASDRDIRELMGARQLYIADVFDIDPQGRTKKPFGRVFYTRGKSLIFYAFDLDQQPGYREARAIQAWGRPGSSQATPVSLGIFYVDNESNRRWVLKSDDPRVLEEIDAVFVTLEPKGGSKKPTNKPFLLAYLHTAPPNHP